MNYLGATMLFHCDEPWSLFILTKLYDWMNLPHLYRENLKKLNEYM